MIASLPMYWRAENAHLWRAFWGRVRAAAARDGLALPDLTAPADIAGAWTDHWLRPDLALSMTCGLPFRSVLRDRVTYVGTLTFGLNCAAGYYFSRIIRAGHLHDRTAQPSGGQLRLAYNSADSQSGWAVTQYATPFISPPRFTQFVKTGSHAASLAAVAEKRADIAYIDAVTWRILKRVDPNARSVHVGGQSIATPALPLITAKGYDPKPLRRAIQMALTGLDLNAPQDSDPNRFGPHDPFLMGGSLGFTVLDVTDYLSLPIPAPPAGH